MKCRQIEQIISAYLDGEVTESEWREAQAHIDGCPHCSQTLQIFQKHTSILKQELVRHEVRPSLWTSVVKRINMQQPLTWHTKFLNWLQHLLEAILLRPPAYLRAAQVGAAIVAVVIFISTKLNQQTTSQLSSHTTDIRIEQALPDIFSEQNIAAKKNKQQLLQVVLAQQINKYFDKAGVLLLEVKNSELDREPMALTSLRETSQSLLEDTMLIKEDLKNTDLMTLRKTIEQLEMVLLDVANLKEAPKKNEIDLLKATILQQGLLIKIEIFDVNELEFRGKKSLQEPKSQGQKNLQKI